MSTISTMSHIDNNTRNDRHEINNTNNNNKIHQLEEENKALRRRILELEEKQQQQQEEEEKVRQQEVVLTVDKHVQNSTNNNENNNNNNNDDDDDDDHDVKTNDDGIEPSNDKHDDKMSMVDNDIIKTSNENITFHNHSTPSTSTSSSSSSSSSSTLTPNASFEGLLRSQEIERYSRQLLLSGSSRKIVGGIHGQQQLLQSRVLIIGAGGIGSTCILYLCAAGVGHISIIDFDTVEVSNLHRQIIHTMSNVGMNKAVSAQQAVQRLNPTIQCTAIPTPLTSSNAMNIISNYDCIVDASDNPQTRYIVNDACVLTGRTLVSGSAIGVEGQLSVYNYDLSSSSSSMSMSTMDTMVPDPNAHHQQQKKQERPQSNRGPCYRCLYPTPNVTEGSKSCSDNGVLGPVPGLIGILQAVETIKVLTSSMDDHDNGQGNSDSSGSGGGNGGDRGANRSNGVLYDRLLMYDAFQCSFLRIKKPPRRQDCTVCGIHPSIVSMEDSFAVIENVRGPNCHTPRTSSNPTSTAVATTTTTTSTNITTSDEDSSVWNITCKDYYNHVRGLGVPHILLDVRVKEQYELCSLPGAVNIPLHELEQRIDDVVSLSIPYNSAVTTNGDSINSSSSGCDPIKPIYCICRRGIASAAATKLLRERFLHHNHQQHQHILDQEQEQSKEQNDSEKDADCGSGSNVNDVSVDCSKIIVQNVKGGLNSWRSQVDPLFPNY